MKFISADLQKLAAFQFSNIDRLELEFSSTVQIILGTNGSGKSSLLRELTPLPSARNTYCAGGYKKLVIQHSNVSYVLTSDYSNKTSPHSFVKDGVELNDGGTTQVQEELVRSELGYTDVVDALVTGSYDFATLATGVRRTLFMNLNPCQLGFVLQYHKQVTSAVRACKANLTMLHERKFVLEQELLPEVQRNNLTNEQQSLQNKTALMIEFLHRADDRLKQFPKTDTIETIDDLQNIRRSLIKQLPDLIKYCDIPRVDQQAYETNLLQTLALYKGRLSAIQEQQHGLMQTRNADVAILADLDENELLRKTALLQQSKQDELAQLKSQSCVNPASHASIVLWTTLDATLQQKCIEFLDIGVTLCTMPVLQKRFKKLQHWQSILQENQLKLQRIHHEMDRIKKLQILQPTDIPDVPCAKQACPLYAHFHNSYTKKISELTSLEFQETKLNLKNNRLNNYLTIRESQLQQQYALCLKMQDIEHMLHQLDVIHTKSVMHDLQHNPLLVHRRTMDWISASISTYKYNELKSELATSVLKQTAQTQIATDEKDRIQQRIASADKKYQELTDRLITGNAMVNSVEKQLTVLNEYQATIATLQQQYISGLNTLKQTWLEHDRTQLQKLIHHLTMQRDSAIRRLGEIDHVIQNQAQLHARYENEIIQQIAKIEKDRVEWQWIESALAKIPISYQVIFLNSIIGMMNKLISKVFSYPFALLPVTEDQLLEYKFPVRVGDTIVPDISVCSDAQKEIVNLTFRLSLMKQLNLTDYPIHLDEVGKSFDTYHKQRLLELLREVLDEHVVNQLYLVNHHALIHEGLTQADVLVLNEANITTPAIYNNRVIFNRVD